MPLKRTVSSNKYIKRKKNKNIYVLDLSKYRI